MFAISFDMVIVDLKKNYGEPYNNAYFEIGKALRKYDFFSTQGSVYLSTNTARKSIKYIHISNQVPLIIKKKSEKEKF